MGASGGGGYIWYEASMFLEDIDVKMAGGKPWYIAAGHELYDRSVVVRKTLGSPNPLQFDSVRTGTGRYYRAIRMRNDLVAFAAGGTSTGDGIIDKAFPSTLNGKPIKGMMTGSVRDGLTGTGYSLKSGPKMFLPAFQRFLEANGVFYRDGSGP